MNLLIQPGRFVVGCNYWASHAGTRMWEDWRPETVESDLALLAREGMQTLRVFPLWPDFQPIRQLYGGQGERLEIRHGEQPLPDTEAGRAGLSEEMLTRFDRFLDIAHSHSLSLIVGLLTGWMSGRLYVPPALETMNVLADALALRWELRLVRAFVRRFREHPAIVGWDLGNECNCMANVSRDQAYAWTAAIANAIRVEDPNRPVVSGMHGLKPDGGAWAIEDAAELTDLLCVHPYPQFTPHCDRDPVDTIRPILHGTAEGRLYTDLGGKPCLCQEVGTLGPMFASDAVAAGFARAALFSQWAHDGHGFLWWCAHDQTRLEHAPYDWHGTERELGLVRADGIVRPVTREMGAFGRFLKSLPFEALPPFQADAVCLLTQDQDHWAAAFGAFLFAKQAGIDIRFHMADRPLPEARLYLMPSTHGFSVMPRRHWHDLQARVAAGATLLVTFDDGGVSEFEEFFGVEIQTREERMPGASAVISGIGEAFQIPIPGGHRLTLCPTRAEVLGREPDGNPVFTSVQRGRGRVLFLGLPIEVAAVRKPGSFHAPDAPPCWRIYRHAADVAGVWRAIRKREPSLGLTEHAFDADRRLVVAVNLSPRPLRDQLVAAGWTVGPVYRGDLHADNTGITIELAPHDAAVFELRRQRA
jgi:hypothetical protein